MTDVQAYKHCLASQAHSAIRIVSHATDILNAWMSSNHLRLSPQKSQYIWFGTRQQLNKDLVALSLEFPTFVFSTSVRDLGVILDQELSFVEHITVLTRSLLLLPLAPAAGGLPLSFLFFYCHLSPCLHSQSRQPLFFSLLWPPSGPTAALGWCS